MNLRKQKQGNNNNKGRQLLLVLRLYISVALQQETANFNVAIVSRLVQRSVLPAEKQKNQLAQTEFCFIESIIMTTAAEITRSPSPLYQRCTAAKDGKCQGGLREQTNAVEWNH